MTINNSIGNQEVTENFGLIWKLANIANKNLTSISEEEKKQLVIDGLAKIIGNRDILKDISKDKIGVKSTNGETVNSEQLKKILVESGNSDLLSRIGLIRDGSVESNITTTNKIVK